MTALGDSADRPRLRVRRMAMTVLPTLAMIVVLLAGLAKAMDAGEFAQALARWTVVPSALATPISLGVIAAEVALAGAWLLGIRRRIVARGALALIVVFSAAMLVEYAVAEAPDCHCFGRLLRHQARQDALRDTLIRNGVLCVMLAFRWRGGTTRGPDEEGGA
ncbi:MAG: hypothetical protein AMXMBFR77_20630 [Phycisphaerales bacterium]|nr:hypothetical protein [Phycisphaerales bacterium]